MLGQFSTRRHALPINFATEDWFYAVVFAFSVKFNSPEHIAMIGKSHRLVAHFFGFFDEVSNADGSIQQGILAMDMKLHEIRR